MLFSFRSGQLAQNSRDSVSTSVSRRYETSILIESFVAFALISELDFEIDMTALCPAISDQSDDSTLFDYVDYFESTLVGTILQGRREVEQFPISLWNQFENAKMENRKPKMRLRDGIGPSRW